MNDMPDASNPWRVAVTVAETNMDSSMKVAWQIDRFLKEIESKHPNVKGLIEYRVDSWKRNNADLENFLLEAPERGTILTIRHWSEAGPNGGVEPGKPSFLGTEGERLKLYQEAIKTGRVNYIDIEGRLIGNFIEMHIPQTVTPIISYHDFEGQTSDSGKLELKYNELIASAKTAFPNTRVIPKIVVNLKDEECNSKLFELMLAHRGEIIAVGMGKHAFETRVKGPNMGSFLTYTYFTNECAPGQPSLNELIRTWEERKYI